MKPDWQAGVTLVDILRCPCCAARPWGSGKRKARCLLPGVNLLDRVVLLGQEWLRHDERRLPATEPREPVREGSQPVSPRGGTATRFVPGALGTEKRELDPARMPNSPGPQAIEGLQKGRRVTGHRRRLPGESGQGGLNRPAALERRGPRYAQADHRVVQLLALLAKDGLDRDVKTTIRATGYVGAVLAFRTLEHERSAHDAWCPGFRPAFTLAEPVGKAKS